jgi:hypothetical protein
VAMVSLVMEFKWSIKVTHDNIRNHSNLAYIGAAAIEDSSANWTRWNCPS